MGLSTLASGAYALHRSDMSIDSLFNSFTSFRTLRGGVSVGVWLPSRGLEMCLAEGRLLWVANTRICALRGHHDDR